MDRWDVSKSSMPEIRLPQRPLFYLLFVLIYILSAQIGIYFALPPASITVFWPPSGLSLAVFLIWGPRYSWHGVFIGYILALSLHQTWEGQFGSLPLLRDLISAGGTTLQTFVAYWLLRCLNLQRFLFTQRQVSQFVLTVCFAGLIASTVGVSAYLSLGLLTWQDGSSIWLTWWIGDVLGMLLFTPAVIALLRLEWRDWNRLFVFRVLYFSLITTAAFYVVFFNSISSEYPLLWLVFVLLTWYAALFGPQGAILGNLGMAIFAISSTIFGHNIFQGQDFLNGLLILQAFVGMMAVISLNFAAFLRERDENLMQLQEANQAKGLFLAKMSHELRTPLNAILGFTRLLLKKEPDLADSSRQYLERVEANGLHLLQMINDILDLSKLEAGKMTFQAVDINVNELLQSLQESNEVLLSEKSLHLKLDLPEQTLWLLADPEKLRQVLENLLSNAIKFSEQGSEIVLRAHLKGEQLSYLEIVDQGVGIAPERQEKIFQVFEQAENDTSRKYGGTGLGLSIAREFCQLMGFQLTLVSSSPEGSTFRVSF